MAIGNVDHKRLGKGLSALLGERNNGIDLQRLSKALDVDSSSKDNVIVEVEVDEIEPSPYQPRKTFSEELIQELAHSIETNGLLQPIVIRRGGEEKRYTLIAGERRLRALKLLKRQKVKAIVRELDDRQMATLAILENIQREDLSPLEEAEGYARLINDFKFTQEEVAKSLGKSRSYIANSIRLLGLDPVIRTALEQQTITSGHARALLSAKQPLEALQKVINEGLSVRSLEDQLRAEKYETNPAPAEPKPSAEAATTTESKANPPKRRYYSSELNTQKSKFTFLSRIESLLAAKTNLPVKATYSAKQQSGKIIFSYQNIEDVERLLKVVSGEDDNALSPTDHTK